MSKVSEFCVSANDRASVQSVARNQSGMRNQRSGMHDQKLGGLAGEMSVLVKFAAEPVCAGESIKAQMTRAWNALGRPPFWRVRDAWWGYAECWVGKAVDDFRMRGAALEAKKADAKDRKFQEFTSEVAIMGARIHRLRKALSSTDTQFYRKEIDALDWVLSQYHRGDWDA